MLLGENLDQTSPDQWSLQVINLIPTPPPNLSYAAQKKSKVQKVKRKKKKKRTNKITDTGKKSPCASTHYIVLAPIFDPVVCSKATLFRKHSIERPESLQNTKQQAQPQRGRVEYSTVEMGRGEPEQKLMSNGNMAKRKREEKKSGELRKRKNP